MMSVERLAGDFGTSCWIGACWTRSEQRGRGNLRRLFDYVDDHAEIEGWTVQGLGVWTHNHSALAIYERLGFVARGDERPSSSHPGRWYQCMVRESRRSP
jgi:GNAT superfamily N-acetyltransferase